VFRKKVKNMSTEHAHLTREELQSMTVRDLLDLKLRPSRLQPLQMDFAQKAVEGKTSPDLLSQHQDNRFVQPSPLLQREVVRLQGLFYENIPQTYEGIELSPVAPLGINSSLTRISQRMILSTVKNVEVLADPASMMAFEIARRQKASGKSPSKNFLENLCTSARLVRGQLFPAESGFLPHFQAFALASGGLGHDGIMETKMIEHLSLFLAFLRQAKDSGEYQADNITVDISNIRITEALIELLNIDRVKLGRHSQDAKFDLFTACDIELPSTLPDVRDLTDIQAKDHQIQGYVKKLKGLADQVDSLRNHFPSVTFGYDLARIAGIGYYNGFCYKITAANSAGDRYPLADGGYGDWLAKLLQNGKTAFCSSGFGLELFGNLFKPN
jgi:hypothetical protein